ncbi:hypothetical protein LCGC14_1406080 [marine sediment metagenome]|uniref:Methyltransferase type 11 domain-containing protein n=1 Tax=marine sediment metagenome TaxID=412755 RepID=A0A0F9MB32_9ZZZZ
MNEKITTLLREARTVLQTAAEPIDWAARMLNNKHGYPPLRLRQQVGDLSDFEGSSSEYVAYLKLLCNLKSGDSLLDIGCGCGLILADTSGIGGLLECIKPGSYAGMDINRDAVSWCERHLQGPRCLFIQLPFLDGKRLPGTDCSVDVVLAKSLFTHLLKEETISYLEEIKRLLKPGGRCLATFFLQDDKEFIGKYTFRYRHKNVSYERDAKPRLAVAYEMNYLSKLIKRLGFSHEVWYGTWRGNGRGLSFQDIIVMRRQQ